MAKTDLTAQRLRELFEYDPYTGVFKHRFRSGNARAGDVAGCTRKSGYWQINIFRKAYGAQRIAWLYVFGEWPIETIDHIDGDPANNSIGNLRDVSHRTNLQNQLRPHNGSKSGILGVWQIKNRWSARIRSRGDHIYLGSFKTAAEAATAYLEAKRRLHEGCTI